MLNLRNDELRGAKTTASASSAVVTQRQLQIRARPRSPPAIRDVSAQLPNLSSSNPKSSGSRMPDRRLRTMSTGDYDPLRRALTAASTKAFAQPPAVQGLQGFTSRTRSDDDMETKTRMMMGRRKDRDLGINRSGGHWRQRDQQNDDNDDEDEDDEELSCARDPVCDDDLLYELQHMGFVAGDDHRALAACATSYENASNNSTSPGFDVQNEGESDGDEDSSYLVDTPELAAFLGLTIFSHEQLNQFPPPMIPKAASFSGHQQGRNNNLQQQQQHSQPMYLRGMVPCSPPMPIPRKQLYRRRNSVTGSLLTARNNNNKYTSPDLCDDDMSKYYSRSQCEARLWDEDWHFKLSLEARESFEANNNNSNTSSTSSITTNSASHNSRGVWKPQSTASMASMASTADTFRDEDEFTGDSGEDDDQVFDMDDL